MKKVILYLLFCLPILSYAQVKWTNVDSLFQPLPSTVHVYFTNDSLDGKPNIAYYVSAEVKDKNLIFTVDTTLERRLTPTKYFVRNDNPLVVVNSTFFEFTFSLFNSSCRSYSAFKNSIWLKDSFYSCCSCM